MRIDRVQPMADLDQRLAERVLELCDAVTVAWTGLIRHLRQVSAALEEEKIHVIPNGYDEEDFDCNYPVIIGFYDYLWEK